MYGWDNTRQHLMMLWEEHQRLRGENHRDNSIDEDGNRIADVDEVNGRELFTRKMKLFLVHADPARMNAAVGGLWHATLGVIGVLKIQFARTVTLGAAIGDVTSKTMGRAATPVLAHLLPAECSFALCSCVRWCFVGRDGCYVSCRPQVDPCACELGVQDVRYAGGVDGSAHPVGGPQRYARWLHGFSPSFQVPGRAKWEEVQR